METGQLADSGAGASLTGREELEFYTDAFFYSIYSSFDVMAQLVNMCIKTPFTQERKVTLYSVARKLQNKRDGLSKVINNLKAEDTYVQLQGYRHCLTHRRQVAIRRLTKSVEDSPAVAFQYQEPKSFQNNWQ